MPSSPVKEKSHSRWQTFSWSDWGPRMSKSTVNGIASARTFFERGKITRALDGQTCRQPAKTVTLDLTREASRVSVRLREILPEPCPCRQFPPDCEHHTYGLGLLGSIDVLPDTHKDSGIRAMLPMLRHSCRHRCTFWTSIAEVGRSEEHTSELQSHS